MGQIGSVLFWPSIHTIDRPPGDADIARNLSVAFAGLSASHNRCVTSSLGNGPRLFGKLRAPTDRKFAWNHW
jgi:hypothetical protein